MLLITSSLTRSIITDNAINFKRFPYILLKFVLHVANHKFADKFSNDGRLLWSVLLLRNKSFCHSQNLVSNCAQLINEVERLVLLCYLKFHADSLLSFYFKQICVLFV